MDRKNADRRVDVLVLGAGPAGLACAITAKKQYPGLSVCVVDKSPVPGGHNISGAALEPKPIEDLLNMTVKDWYDAPIVRDVLSRKVFNDQMYLLSKTSCTRVSSFLNLAGKFHLPLAQISSKGCYIVSLSKLTRLLVCIAKNIGVDLLFGLTADDLVYNGNSATGVKIIDKENKEQAGIDEGSAPGWIINADYIVLAEGCDGYVTEKFITRCGLTRSQKPVFSVGAKEIIQVSSQQYKAFGDCDILHLPGYPLWRFFKGPSILGKGLMYSMGDNRIAVVLTASLSWKYPDFSPQKALALLKEHPFVNRYIMDGRTIENGVKMLPEGGYCSIPTDPKAGTIGKSNVVVIGDCASFLNTLKQKGIGNAIVSGMSAGFAVGNIQNKTLFSTQYTDILRSNGFLTSLKNSSRTRQIMARAGVGIGLPLSSISRFLPLMQTPPDNSKMYKSVFPYEPQVEIDKSEFVLRAGGNRQEQHKCHIQIKDLDVCKWECMRTYDCPCVTFCPAGVFDKVLEHVQPVNSAKCMHCRSCLRKCPYDNIYWSLPQAASGPRYQFS